MDVHIAVTEPGSKVQIGKECMFANDIDIRTGDSHSILFFGSRAQEELTTVSDRMLEKVRTKDLGPAGSALNDMVLTLRGFDVEPVRMGSDLDLAADGAHDRVGIRRPPAAARLRHHGCALHRHR